MCCYRFSQLQSQVMACSLQQVVLTKWLKCGMPILWLNTKNLLDTGMPSQLWRSEWVFLRATSPFSEFLIIISGTHDLYSASLDRTVKAWNCDNKSYMDTLYGHQVRPQTLCSSSDYFVSRRASLVLHHSVVNVVWLRALTRLFAHGRFWRRPSSSSEVQLKCSIASTYSQRIPGSRDHNKGMRDNWLKLREISTLLRTLHIWNVNKKKPVATMPKAHSGQWISAIAALPYSDLVASGSCDGFVRLWKVKNQSSFELIHEIPVVRKSFRLTCFLYSAMMD